MIFSMAQIEKFLLVFVRVSTVLAMVPIFGSSNMPKQVMIFFSLVLSLAMFTAVSGIQIAEQKTLVSFMLSVGSEVLIGLSIGFLTRLIFVAIQFAGEIVGMQMGFGISRVLDPQSGSQVSLVGQYKSVMAFLIFLFLDGHHLILLALGKSLSTVPLLGASFTEPLMNKLTVATTDMFSVAIVIAAPILASIFLTEVALGVLARTMPQMNIFLVGFPVKIIVGMLLLGLSVPILFDILRDWIDNFQLEVVELIGILSR